MPTASPGTASVERLVPLVGNPLPVNRGKPCRLFRSTVFTPTRLPGTPEQKRVLLRGSGVELLIRHRLLRQPGGFESFGAALGREHLLVELVEGRTVLPDINHPHSVVA